MGASCKTWYKGLTKGSLGKDASEKIWQFESNEKDIAVDIGTQIGGCEQISYKAQNSGEENAETVGENRFEHRKSL